MAKKEEQKEKIEREYIIPLRKKFRKAPRYKRTPKAIKAIKEFLVRHMKIYDRDLNKIKIDKYLNEFLWARGIKNPPAKVKVKATKEGEKVKVELVEYPTKLKFKKAREERIEKQALEKAEKKKSLLQKAKEGLQEKPKQKEEKEVEEKKSEANKKTLSVEETKKIEIKKSKHVAEPKAKVPKRQPRKALAK